MVRRPPRLLVIYILNYVFLSSDIVSIGGGKLILGKISTVESE